MREHSSLLPHPHGPWGKVVKAQLSCGRPFAVPRSYENRENTYTLEQLEGLGITEKTVIEKLSSSFRGWLCQSDDPVVMVSAWQIAPPDSCG